MLRFHLDENMPSALATGLRRRGIDVSTTAESGLLEATDLQHLAFALNESRVVVTHDTDFIRLHAEGNEHAGIVIVPQQTRTIGEMISALLLISQRLSMADMRRQLIFI